MRSKTPRGSRFVDTSRYPASRAPRVSAVEVKPCDGTCAIADERIADSAGEKGGGSGYSEE